MDTSDFAFFNNADYFRQLTDDVKAADAGTRAAVATMDLNSRDEHVGALLTELLAAAQRGVQVVLAIDARTFLLDKASRLPGPLWFKPTLEPEKLREPFKTFYGWLEKLQQAGAQTVITNKPRKSLSNPAAGRSHIKTGVVGDKVYVGGCNLDNASNIDVMVSWSDKRAADWLFGMVAQVAQHGNTRKAFHERDAHLELSPEMQLVRDAGVPNQSLILETAVQLVSDAEKWVVYTGQYFPNGPIYKALLGAAYRGARVEIYYAHPSIHGLEEPIHRLYNLRGQTVLAKKATVHQLPKTAPKLHAKVLATENGAMVGSHNYIQQGVKWGTAELALCYEDPTFSKQLKTFIATEIEKNS